MQEQQTVKGWMNMAEASAYLGISKATLLRRIQQGAITCAGGPGEVKTFDRRVVEDYLRGKPWVQGDGTR